MLVTDSFSASGMLLLVRQERGHIAFCRIVRLPTYLESRGAIFICTRALLRTL